MFVFPANQKLEIWKFLLMNMDVASKMAFSQ